MANYDDNDSNGSNINNSNHVVCTIKKIAQSHVVTFKFCV